tara:strand:- start:652 stop:1254 length:603 start_codon:yes stop_codon:yes gene_type:complete
MEVDLNDYESFVKERLLFRYPNARFSKFFSMQLYIFYQKRFLNIWGVLDELDYLEGKRTLTTTKKEREFKRTPELKGVWYKHFYSTSFIGRNLLNHLSNKNMKVYIKEAHEAALVESDYEESFRSILSYKMTVKVFEDKWSSKTITGEWIIYIPRKNENWYLMLAEHKSDDIIVKQLDEILAEFGDWRSTLFDDMASTTP